MTSLLCRLFLITLCLCPLLPSVSWADETVDHLYYSEITGLTTQTGQIIKPANIYVPIEDLSLYHKWMDNFVTTIKPPVTLTHSFTNRHEHIVANIQTADTPSLSERLVMTGLALTFPTPNSDPDFINHLYSAEKIAQDQRLGLWDKDGFTSLTPHTINDTHLNSFQIITGTVLGIHKSYNNLYLNFGTDYKTDFTIMIPNAVLKQFPHDFDTDEGFYNSWVGQTITTRGWVEEYNGPMIKLSTPLQINS